MRRKFHCPRCKTELFIHAWDAVGTRATGPARFRCTGCRATLLFPMRWRLASAGLFFVVLVGSGLLFNYLNPAVEWLLLLVPLVLLVMWGSGALLLLSPELSVDQPRS